MENKKLKQPCNQCPYRKDSTKGWLGEASYDPESFLQQLHLPTPHPCHVRVDWNGATKNDIECAPHCIGELQFMNNSLKLSRYPEFIELQKEVGKNDELFKWESEFIRHHKK
jgi:hypothetical protein